MHRLPAESAVEVTYADTIVPSRYQSPDLLVHIYLGVILSSHLGDRDMSDAMHLVHMLPTEFILQ